MTFRLRKFSFLKTRQYRPTACLRDFNMASVAKCSLFTVSMQAAAHYSRMSNTFFHPVDQSKTQINGYEAVAYGSYQVDSVIVFQLSKREVVTLWSRLQYNISVIKSDIRLCECCECLDPPLTAGSISSGASLPAITEKVAMRN